MTSIEARVLQPYKYGFVTDIESELAPAGLSEDIIRLISEKKGEPGWMLEWRLQAYRQWLKMQEPKWANVHYGPIDYQAIHYYAAPKQRKQVTSLEEVDPKLLETFERLGIPISEQKRLSGVAVDAVFDSVSVATTFKETLAKAGVIFLPISEAIREHPDLVKEWLGSVVPHNDNFFAALNSAAESPHSSIRRRESSDTSLRRRRARFRRPPGAPARPSPAPSRCWRTPEGVSSCRASASPGSSRGRSPPR